MYWHVNKVGDDDEFEAESLPIHLSKQTSAQAICICFLLF